MARRYENGVLWYSHGRAEIEVHFPEDEVACHYCPFLTQDIVRREICCITREIIPDSDYMIGGKCPLNIVKDR